MAQQAYATETQVLTPSDLEEIALTMQQILDHSQRLIVHLVSENINSTMFPVSNTDSSQITKSFQTLIRQIMLKNPVCLAETQLTLWKEYARLWENTLLRMMGANPEPYIQPVRGDNRFRDESWSKYPAFDLIKQHYLMIARWLENVVNSVQFNEDDAKQAEKVRFYTHLMIDALSPSNFVATNPEVLIKAIQTNGKSLLKGLNQLLADLEQGQGRQLRISMTDTSAFEIGSSLACTPGKVVFQNDLMQLIQYQPSTEDVYKKPLMIVPPWINKYYILDLRAKNSFVKWLVDQGHTVFVISWINPDETLAHKKFENYMLEGPVAAMAAIEQATGEQGVNAIGYCLGGTLLACTSAYMAARQDTRLLSTTYFTTMIDFSDPGELGIFIDEEQVTSLESQMEEKGYLEGSSMAMTFNMLRANDLIWSFYINNYLKGEDPRAFDILYWNSDSTRMPASMHSYYLRNLYIKNLLKEPGGLILDNVPIDLSQVETPCCFISTQEDHIAPWKSTYAGAQLFSGPVRFILGGSGHIAGIVNPPANNKYFYFTNNRTKSTKNPDTWLNSAVKHEGSWWPEWEKWVSSFSGDKIKPRDPAKSGLPVLEDAPGSYVKATL